MCYHARALAAGSVEVDLVGLEGTQVPPSIRDEPRIRVHRISGSTLRYRRGLTAVTYVLGATLRRSARELSLVADAADACRNPSWCSCRIRPRFRRSP